jgi:hypothetical protein
MTTSPDDLEAVRKVIEALTPFNGDDQERIVRWAREKLGLSPSYEEHFHSPSIERTTPVRLACFGWAKFGDFEGIRRTEAA